MSIARIALRMAAVEALKGRTLVGANVLDSPNGALDIQADGNLRTAQEKPFVSVFTDFARKENPNSRGLYENGAVDLVFEIGVSTAMFEKDKLTGRTFLVGIEVPPTDGAREFFLDLVQRQIFDALSDPGNAWGQIYLGLHTKVAKIDFAGARSAEDGQKLTGHQIRLTLDLINDPAVGQPLSPMSPIAKFLTLLQQSELSTHRDQAAALVAVLDQDLSSVEKSFRRYGLVYEQARAMLLTMQDGVPDDQVITDIVSPDQTVLLPEAAP